MIRNFTILLFSLLFCISIGFAKDVKINKKASSLAKKKYCSVNEMIQEPAQPIFPIDENNIVPTSVNNVITATRTTDYAYHMLIDSCRNGFGWLKPSLHSIDRSVDANFLILCYRHYNLSNPASGIIGATEIDLSSGLEGADVFSITNLNDDLGPFPPDEHWKSIGGRYPGAVALDKPIFSFNQYFSGDAETTPAVSSPYLVTDYGTYGYSGGAWTSTLKMDEGYTHQGFSENRLWQNAVSVVKGSDAKYHYLGAYRNWTIEGESQSAEYVLLTADADDPSSWNINTNPALIDTFDYLIYPAVSMNSNGFGAAVGLGHAGNDPDNSFYMSELRPMVMFTSNYGLTWTHQREVSWEELDIPETISFSDSIWVPESVGDTNYVLYEGDAYVAIPNNHGLDVLVSENNDIYFAFDLSWGPWANEEQTTYYRDYRHCGVHVAASYNEGVSFKANHVAICNGFFEGDSSSEEAEDNFFLDSEAELALDDQGALYVAWLDRPGGKNIEVAEKMRYNYTNEELLLKADIFTSRSLDKGNSWSSRINITQSNSLDEYELKMALHADSKNNGTIYVAYCLVDPNSSVTPPDPDVYTYRVNRMWVSEANDFPTAIGNDYLAKTVKDFALKQNYPNPFNPTTTIEFVPLSSGQAMLDIYSITGEKVTELYKGYVKKGKKYTFDFNGSRLASGVYFYRLKIGSKVEVKKMALIK